MDSNVGKIIWFDLTVDNASAVRDFYQQVVGWSPEPVDMGDYQDYTMKATNGEVAAGICHKRGDNQRQPPQWMLYITVANLDQSLAACESNGGTILVPIRSGGNSRFAVIQDPAGAVCTLYEQQAT
ncbi:MAG: VOC family protein [Anaerolineae bacterium]|nr:VOC family protein [Anaerolineae bacterium]